VAGRVLVGYLLFKIFTSMRADAAPTTSNNTDASDLCTAEGLQEFLEQTGSLTGDDIELAYQHCRGRFLDESTISPEVKQTIDDWVGTDLGKAETNQIFLAYELALVGQRPERLSENFVADCHRMVGQFQAFRDSLEPLMSRVEIDLDSLLAGGSEEIEDDERQLLNFVQYSQFCQTLLRYTGGHEANES
jgi:hypothetical protein